MSALQVLKLSSLGIRSTFVGVLGVLESRLVAEEVF